MGQHRWVLLLLAALREPKAFLKRALRTRGAGARNHPTLCRVGVGGGGVVIVMHNRSPEDGRPSHADNAGTGHVGFSPIRQILLACTNREPP